MNDRMYMSNLDSMTGSQLKNRYYRNRRRMFGNGVFLGMISIGSLFLFPPAIIATLSVGAFRLYHLNKNNQIIEKKAEEAGVVLKKIRK